MIKKTLLLLLSLCASHPLYSMNPTADSLQMIVSLADDWASTTGFLQTYERTTNSEAWRAVGEKIPVSFGKNGLGWGTGLHDEALRNFDLFKQGPRVVEGARRSPVGVFGLNIAFGRALSAEELQSIKLLYVPITPHVWGVDDIKSSHYNRIEDDQLVAKDWDSAEDMNRYLGEGVYEYGVFIEHNYDRPIPGQGSCFFIHVHRRPGVPTWGCTAFSSEQVRNVMFWVDRAKKPILVQLPREIFNVLKNVWSLPEFPA